VKQEKSVFNFASMRSTLFISNIILKLCNFGFVSRSFHVSNATSSFVLFFSSDIKMSTYSKSEPYRLFRSWVAQNRVTVEHEHVPMVWKYYDFGPKDSVESANIPLIMIPGASGGAESFFKQFISLCPKGYRIISVQWPGYLTHQEWCQGFDKLLDKLHLTTVHLFGTSVGGYLAQCYVAFKPQRVQSLVLCNAFCDTKFWIDNAPCMGMFPMMPEFFLKRMILSNFPAKQLESEIANSVDFMVEQIESLKKEELVSRLTLNCSAYSNLHPDKLAFDKSKITIMDCMDEVAIPESIRDEVYKYYPEAKISELKTGGNFPFLSRADDVNLFLQVHIRRNTPGRNNESNAESESVASSTTTSTTTQSQPVHPNDNET